MNVCYKCMEFYGWGVNIKGDILVKKIEVKKSICLFPTPSFSQFFANFLS